MYWSFNKKKKSNLPGKMKSVCTLDILTVRMELDSKVVSGPHEAKDSNKLPTQKTLTQTNYYLIGSKKGFNVWKIICVKLRLKLFAIKMD